jgi:uncharacterized protein (TIGR03067 family)
MKRPGVSAVLVVALVAAAAPGGGGEAGKKELEKLQGTWKVLKAVKAGDPEPADKVQKMSVVIAGDKMTLRGGKNKEEFRIKVDPSKKPVAIDLQPPGQKKAALGIYKLEKGQLLLCVALDFKPPRPTEFTSTQKTGTVLLVLERERK